MDRFIQELIALSGGRGDPAAGFSICALQKQCLLEMRLIIRGTVNQQEELMEAIRLLEETADAKVKELASSYGHAGRMKLRSPI